MYLLSSGYQQQVCLMLRGRGYAYLTYMASPRTILIIDDDAVLAELYRVKLARGAFWCSLQAMAKKR